MNAGQYLRKYRLYKAERLNLLTERNLIVMDEALPSGIDYSADRVQSSPDDKMIAIVERIQKRSREIDNRIEWLDSQMQQIVDEINALDDPIAKRLLFLRYVARYDWYKITDALIEEFFDDSNKDYTVTYIRGKLHKKCLRKFDEKFPKNS